jgi:biotin-dependent carboxylase-like uncharacterized protein
MVKVEVIEAGLQTTLQDKGRIDYQHIGMPVGGAMDLYSLQLANYLVGNKPFEGCLETTMLGPKLFFSEKCIIGITGALTDVGLNGDKVPMYKMLKVNAGDVLTIGRTIKGSRTYIAFGGGVDVPFVLGSKSTYLRGKTGGVKGRALMAGDVLKITGAAKRIKRSVPVDMIPEFENNLVARIIPGPEAREISMDGLRSFLTCEFELTNECDRMGYRLSGDKISHNSDANIISSGITYGTIQVPPDGSPIIMMADRQTMGGYVRIGNVISADHSYLGQLKPGDKIRFKETELQKAGMLFREQQEKLNRLFSKL